MLGQMMDRPLLISSLLEFAVVNHPQAEIVTRRVEGDIHRCTWREVADRSACIANALTHLGVKTGDRIGSLAWNTYRHLELYFGVSGMGSTRVCSQNRWCGLPTMPKTASCLLI